MKRINVEVTYDVEIETDLEDGDEIDAFIADYLANEDIEAVSNGCTFKITNIYED